MITSFMTGAAIITGIWLSASLVVGSLVGAAIKLADIGSASDLVPDHVPDEWVAQHGGSL